MLERRISSTVFLFLFGAVLLGSQPIPNWPAPASWTPPRASGVRPLGIESDIAGPLPFVPTTPCRQYDSRNATPLLNNTSRTVPLVGGLCGIPLSAAAVSVNITVFNVSGALGNAVFRVGIVLPPPTAWINFPPNETQRANAGVVSLNSSGEIVVQVNMGAGQVDFTCDVNGYYSGNVNLPFDLFIDSSVPALQVQNFSGSCAIDCGISSVVLSTSGGDAILGWAAGGSGTNYGVLGLTSSTSSGTAGVLGIPDGGGRPTAPGNYLRAGVRGESFVGYGVLGVSRSTGVGAALVDSGGSQVAYALLGAAGPTNYAVFAGGSYGGTGAKYFVEPHPTDASKVIRYVSLEGPESGTYFRGRGKFQNGLAVIEVPEDFRMVTDPEGLSVQVTPVGEFANVAVVQIELDRIVVKASRNVEFFYMVNGVRKTHKDLKPIGPGNEFVPQSAEAKIPAHLTEGQKAMLISNGTYNEDGTVNMRTAERVGWTKMWAEREEEARAAAAKFAAERKRE